VIFLDTSAIYALADERDARHRRATEQLEAVRQSGEELLTHNDVVLEALALRQHRLGRDVALKFARTAETLTIEWVDQRRHQAAVRRRARGARAGSLVDQVSFLLMRARGVRTALAFDDDFVAEGFRLYARPASRSAPAAVSPYLNTDNCVPRARALHWARGRRP
jgi:predicted nucleic acid-binding protein